MRDPDNWPAGIVIDSAGNIAGYTKGPYALEENAMHPEQICRRLSALFRDATEGLEMRPERYRCFRVQACCIATWLVGLCAGSLALCVRIHSNPHRSWRFLLRSLPSSGN